MALKPGERDELVPQLWIGDFASTKDKDALRKAKITHILTVAKELAEVDKASLSEFNHKNYDFEDADDQLVLPSFEEINEFIKGGIAAGGVLVVSYSGVSRCALIALEYLMGLMNLTYEEAVKMVTDRRLVSLNHNFVVQLKLYETMKCKFNRKSKKFASFQATLKDEQSAKRDLFKKAGAYVPHDPQMVARLKTLCKKQAETELKKKSFGKGPKEVEQGKLFACANCRHKLFAPQNIVTEDSDLKDWSNSSYIYIEPPDWIKGDLNNIQGDFQCPECHIGLGQWDWEGSLISPSTKVVPSFKIHKAHLCSLSKKNAKSKEKVTFGYKGWEGFVKEHPLGYPSPILPENPILSPRSSAPETEASSDGEKEQEKKKDGGDDEDETKPKRKPPPPPKKNSPKEVSEGDDSSAERLNNSGKHEEDKKAGGLKGFMGRFKKKNGKNPSEKPPGSPVTSKARKPSEAKPAPEQKKDSNEDFGEDNIQPVSKAQAQEALELTCPEDLPKEILKVIKNSKISDEDMADNFIILLNCLHFLTKRHFVVRPKREEGDTEEKGEEEVIKIGGAKKKKKKKQISNLPPASELVTEGDVKKAYKMQEIVGEGGFGRVHSARNLKGKGRVAIKKMAHVAEREKQRNFKEINFLRTVDHPCIVKYFCSYVVKEELWVVMEFMEGGTLTEALKGFSFEEKHIAYAAKEMLKGIKYLHARNLVHRDLKSGNIMMTTQGDVKLIDFGLCVDLAEEKEPEHMVGSPFWMPPEMIKRQIYGPAVDIWSFAICVLELANGQPPNRRSALKAMFVAGTTGYPQPFNKPEHWSSNFKDFIGRCLEMEPSKRATAEELLKHPFLEKADTKKGMKKILSHIFLQNTIDMMNLGGI